MGPGGPAHPDFGNEVASEPVETVTTTTMGTSPAGPGTAGTATLRREPGDTGPTPPGGATIRRDPRSAGAALSPVHPAGQWVVTPGDHLWSIAAAQLAGSLGRPPTDRETDPYWRLVIDANRQLAHPDLLFPGEAINLPPLSGRHRATMERLP